MDKPKPDPDCRWCRGTGEVLLVVTVVPCDCLITRSAEDEIRLVDEDDEPSLGGLGLSNCHI